MSGGMTRLPRHLVPRSPRASSSRGEAFVPCGRVVRSCRRRKKKGKEGRNETEIQRWIEAWKFMTRRVYSHWFTRGLTPCVSFCQPRVSRGQTMISHVIPSSISVSASLSLSLHVSCHSMTGRNYCRRYLEACRAIFFSRLHSCNYEQFQLLFPRPR